MGGLHFLFANPSFLFFFPATVADESDFVGGSGAAGDNHFSFISCMRTLFSVIFILHHSSRCQSPASRERATLGKVQKSSGSRSGCAHRGENNNPLVQSVPTFTITHNTDGNHARGSRRLG